MDGVYIDVEECPCCGEPHNLLWFTDTGTDEQYTYESECPLTEERILLRFDTDNEYSVKG